MIGLYISNPEILYPKELFTLFNCTIPDIYMMFDRL